MRRFLLPWGCAALLLLLPQLSSGQQPAFAFVGVNVIPLNDDKTVLRDHTVIVRNGRIDAMGPRADIAVPPNAIRILANGQYLILVLSPRIYTAGQVLDGDPPVRDDNCVLRNAEDARKAVEEQASEGYDFIKVYANLSPEAFRSIIATARARRVPTYVHSSANARARMPGRLCLVRIIRYGSAATSTGVPRLAGDPVPSWPLLPRPQQYLRFSTVTPQV